MIPVLGAERELTEAVNYYNEQRPGLGFEFAAEVKVAFDRIEAFPGAWQPFSTRARRYVLHRFPYGVLYQAVGDDILVLAIMHLRRHPRRWQERLEQEMGEDTAPPEV